MYHTGAVGTQARGPPPAASQDAHEQEVELEEQSPVFEPRILTIQTLNALHRKESNDSLAYKIILNHFLSFHFLLEGQIQSQRTYIHCFVSHMPVTAGAVSG